MQRALSFYRIGHAIGKHTGLWSIAQLFTLLTRFVFGAWVPVTAQIGRGVKLGYMGSGVIIHKDARIGENTVIGAGVVIGGRDGRGVPPIGKDVYIGAGAKILSAEIGDGAKIGVNAVVVEDVPAGATVVGPKARILN